MDPEPTPAVGGGPASPSDAHQISSDPEPDADDWDEDARRGAAAGAGAGGAGEADKRLELDEVDWNAINDEVEAAMNESDDEDGKSEKSVRFENGSDDEGSWTDETNSMIRYESASHSLETDDPENFTPVASTQHLEESGNDCEVSRPRMVDEAWTATETSSALRWRNARRWSQIAQGSQSSRKLFPQKIFQRMTALRRRA